LEPLDSETEELYRAYRYCKLFHCSVSEYESRPAKETTWMLKIDDAYTEVVREIEAQQNAR
jgi:hypothetical protein